MNRKINQIRLSQSIVPRKAIFDCCERFAAKMKRTNDIDKMRQLSERFIDNIEEILHRPKMEDSEITTKFNSYRRFRHDLGNWLGTNKLFVLTHDINNAKTQYRKL